MREHAKSKCLLSLRLFGAILLQPSSERKLTSFIAAIPILQQFM